MKQYQVDVPVASRHLLMLLAASAMSVAQMEGDSEAFDNFKGLLEKRGGTERLKRIISQYGIAGFLADVMAEDPAGFAEKAKAMGAEVTVIEAPDNEPEVPFMRASGRKDEEVQDL